MAMSNVLTSWRQQSSSLESRQDLQVEATRLEVGAYVERKNMASSAPVSKVVVMGKWTVAGCLGWPIMELSRINWRG